MLNIFKSYKDFFNRNERSVLVKKNIIESIVIKSLSTVSAFILVPLTINLLDQQKYGIWITIFSIISWFNMMDIGIGNGFRNKFAEARALGSTIKTKEYVQVLYSSAALIATLILIIFTIATPFLNWFRLLNLPESFDENISLIVWVVFALFCLQIYLKNISTLLLALQKTSYSDALIFFGNISSLIIIFILSKLKLTSLFSIAVSFMIGPIFIFILATLREFSKNLIHLRPTLFSFPKKKYFNEILELGLKFFFLQIAALIIYNLGSIIIAHMYGPAHVTPYNIAFRLFSATQVLFSIIIAPFWSAFTESNAKKDLPWIRNSIKRLILVWFLFGFGVLGFWAVSPYFFKLWVGDKVHIPSSLSFQFAIFVILNSWSSIYISFLSGIGKIKLFSYIAIIQVVSYFPLVILLTKKINLDVIGVILATNLNLLIPAVVLSLQTRKILLNRAFGIWSH